MADEEFDGEEAMNQLQRDLERIAEPFGQPNPNDAPSKKFIIYAAKSLVSAGSGIIVLASSAAAIPLANLTTNWALPLLFIGIPSLWTAWGGFLAFAVWRREMTEWLRKRSS